MVSKKLNLEFNAIKNDIKEAYIAVGMITEKQYDFFIRNITASKISIIVGSQMPTPPAVFIKLKQATSANKLEGRVFTNNFFHPKLYLFKLSMTWMAFVGSGNFTTGGWASNEELFITLEDQATCKLLKQKFDSWYMLSKAITDHFIQLYTSMFNTIQPKQREIRRNISQLDDQLNGNFNINNVHFSNQFFTKAHHEAFAPGKTYLETDAILVERGSVRNRLYDLNDELVRLFPPNWHIYPHYDTEHIVSHIENNFHHDYNVKGLWVAYGRSRAMLKQYSDSATPLGFMRMQVIVGYDYVGTSLMPGKVLAGQVDREYFLSKMQSDEVYRGRFFTLLTSLGSYYWVEVAADERSVTSFKNEIELLEYLQQDNWRAYYFIIGRNYNLGSTELKENNIVNTIMNDFSKYQPLYEMIREKTAAIV
jgi:HKD family nuclease